MGNSGQYLRSQLYLRLASLSLIFLAATSLASNRTSCLSLVSRSAFLSHPDLSLPESLGVEVPPLSRIVDAAVVVLRREGRLLMGLRTGGTGEGTWGFVGGKVDPGESILEAVVRETREEIGIHLGTLRYRHTLFDYRPENRQWYRVFFLEALSFEGEPRIMEPHKMTRLEWFSKDALPQNLFPSNRDFLDHFLDPSGE